MNKRNPKLNKDSLYCIGVDLSICDKVVELINNVHLRDNETTKLYEVLIDPLYCLINKYVILFDVSFNEYEVKVAPFVTKGDLRRLNLKLNNMQVRINHRGEYIQKEDKETLKEAYEVAKSCFRNYEGGK